MRALPTTHMFCPSRTLLRRGTRARVRGIEIRLDKMFSRDEVGSHILSYYSELEVANRVTAPSGDRHEESTKRIPCTALDVFAPILGFHQLRHRSITNIPPFSNRPKQSTVAALNTSNVPQYFVPKTLSSSPFYAR